MGGKDRPWEALGTSPNSSSVGPTGQRLRKQSVDGCQNDFNFRDILKT